MITLFGYVHFFNFVSFLLYPTEVKRLRCAMLGAFTVNGVLLAGLLWLALFAGFKVLLGSGVSGTDPHFESFWIRTP